MTNHRKKKKTTIYLDPDVEATLAEIRYWFRCCLRPACDRSRFSTRCEQDNRIRGGHDCRNAAIAFVGK